MLCTGQHQTLQQDQIPGIGLDFSAMRLVFRPPDLPEVRPGAEVDPLTWVRGGYSVADVTTDGDAAVVGGTFLPAVEISKRGVESGVESGQVGRGRREGWHSG